MKRVSRICDIILRITIILIFIINVILGHHKFIILLPVMFIISYYDVFAKKVFKLDLRDSTKIFLTCFIFLAQVLAVNLDFYTLIPCWDIILHLLSGFMTYIIAEDLLNSYRKRDKKFKINKLFEIMFCVIFSMAVANLWEIIEFSCDRILGVDMQKTKGFTEGLALADTMEDIISATVSAVILAFYNIIRRGK